ncbi:MAG: LysM peptidoglycan-binding domain-containing protein, partial [Clostridiales bacterium]|nr:LysM peptidoglycan-binding domain-containing protein [Clostridiales bacterium]
DIAKRYNTSVEAIMEENELEGEVLEQRGMLLIPIVG